MTKKKSSQKPETSQLFATFSKLHRFSESVTSPVLGVFQFLHHKEMHYQVSALQAVRKAGSSYMDGLKLKA
jgi:hypothetical protein